MTFPADVVADSERYYQKATLPRRETSDERAEDAGRRRDLAVDGYGFSAPRSSAVTMAH